MKRRYLVDHDLPFFGAPRGICRFCGGRVVPPRRTWCGEACIEEWRTRTDSAHARRLVLARDGHRCVKCGAGGTLEVDHIVPIAEGGKGVGLDGLRTLCRPCHRAETRALAGRLAARRRGERHIDTKA